HQISRMDPRFFPRSFLGMKGLIFYEMGNLSGAAEAYRADLTEASRTGRPSSDPAWDALLRGDLEEAGEASKKRLEKDPSEMGALLTLGEIALERGDLGEALNRFEKVLEKETDQFDALLLSSVVQARLGQYEKSVRLLNRALRYNRVESRMTSFFAALKEAGELADLPKEKRPFCLLAHYYRYFRIFHPSNGKVAIRYASKAIASEDQIDNAYVTLGVVYDKEENPEKALASFLKAIEANPQNAEAYRRSAMIYSHRGEMLNEYRMRKAAYEAERDPFYFGHLNNFLTEKMGDYHQALALSEGALATAPNDVKALHWVAHLYGFTGDPKRSIEYYQRARLLEPENPVFYQGIGSGLSELGRKEEAIEAYLKAASIDPSRPGPHFGLAALYRDQRHLSDAIQEYEKAFRFAQGEINLQANLCILYYQVSQFQRSADCFKRVLILDPRNKTAQHLLPYTLTNLRKGPHK